MAEARNVEERYFATHDGEQLFYRHWPAEGQARGAILLLHRGHEHSGRVAHLVDELGLGDFDFFAWDAWARSLTRATGLQSQLRHVGA